jgi:hypothetical protein
MALDLTSKKEQPPYPFMQIGFPPQGGILLTIVYSAFEKHDIHVPQENATAMCAAYMAQQPGDAIKQMLQLRKEAQKQQATLQAAMANPRGTLKAVN